MNAETHMTDGKLLLLRTMLQRVPGKTFHISRTWGLQLLERLDQAERERDAALELVAGLRAQLRIHE